MAENSEKNRKSKNSEENLTILNHLISQLTETQVEDSIGFANRNPEKIKDYTLDEDGNWDGCMFWDDYKDSGDLWEKIINTADIELKKLKAAPPLLKLNRKEVGIYCKIKESLPQELRDRLALDAKGMAYFILMARGKNVSKQDAERWEETYEELMEHIKEHDSDVPVKEPRYSNPLSTHQQQFKDWVENHVEKTVEKVIEKKKKQNPTFFDKYGKESKKKMKFDFSQIKNLDELAKVREAVNTRLVKETMAKRMSDDIDKGLDEREAQLNELEKQIPRPRNKSIKEITSLEELEKVRSNLKAEQEKRGKHPLGVELEKDLDARKAQLFDEAPQTPETLVKFLKSEGHEVVTSKDVREEVKKKLKKKDPREKKLPNDVEDKRKFLEEIGRREPKFSINNEKDWEDMVEKFKNEGI